MRLPAILSAVFVIFAVVSVACGDDGAEPTQTPSPTATVVVSPIASPEPATPPGGERIPLTTAEIVRLLRPSVVHVLIEGTTFSVFGQPIPTEGVGTGFIIDDEGYIVTNNHVVFIDGERPAQDITVTLSDGRQFEADLVGGDRPTDLAVLKVDAENLVPATLGDTAELQVGDDVVAIGHALDLAGGPTVTRGVVSAKERLIQEDPYMIPGAIQTDAPINPGNSGGPLVNMYGEVVGIPTQVIRGTAEGIGFAISIDTVKPIVAELIEKGQVERGYLGINLINITPTIAEEYDLPVDSGVGIGSVQDDSPADRAGLMAGDIIVGAAGEEIRNSGELLGVLTEHKAGETITIEYYRDGDLEEAEVILG
ncbi:MAG: trypsin-like peptidase domain-containing protein [Dehalococcoidia bacterium]|nr:MAG: trypsin-like peptidase domain-containing protein [Dehalococcoidia bacterium]